MANLTADQIRNFKEIILSYLLGEDLSGLAVSLQTECSKVKTNCKSIYQSIKLGNCGIVAMETDPTTEEVDQIFAQLHHTDSVIAFNDQLYFADQASRTIEIVKVTEHNQDAVAQLREKITDDYRKVDFDEMELIRTATGNPDIQDDELITSILACLNIKKSTDPKEPGEYEKLLSEAKNLHELLLLLCHTGHHHLRYITKMIESTHPKHNWTLAWLFSTVSSAGFGIFFYLNQQYLTAIGQWFATTFPTILQWLGRTFSLLRNIPILGIIYKSIALLWNWVEAFRTGTTTKEEKRNGLFFKTLAAAFSITAYALTMVAGGLMAFPAAFLFVLSSATEVFLSCYRWYKSKKAIEPVAPASWEEWAEYYRADSLYQQNKKVFYVNVIAAILTTAAVAIWCFFPPTIILTVACVSFMALTALTARSILSTIEENAANRLQETLASDEYIPILPGEELLPSKRKLMVSILAQQERQHAKEVILHTWEQELERRVEQSDIEIEERRAKLKEDEIAFEKHKKEAETNLAQREASFLKTCDSTVKMINRLSHEQRQKSVSPSKQPSNAKTTEEMELENAAKRKKYAEVALAAANEDHLVEEAEFRDPLVAAPK